MRKSTIKFRPLDLEPREVPAVLDVSGGVLTFTDAGSEPNNLTVSVSGGVYSFKDTGTVITLGAGATGAGWRGSGTSTVSGPDSSVDSIQIAVGGGTNTVNVKSILDPIAIDGGSGATAVNLNSVAPVHIGNLSLIQAPVAVIAGADTSLHASDYLGTSRANPIVIDADSIDGLAPYPISLSGTLTSLRVGGSNNSGLAEEWHVANPPATYFRLDGNGGVDSVYVDGDVTGDFHLGAGDDYLYVAPTATVFGSVFGGAGTDTFDIQGTVTGSVVQ